MALKGSTLSERNLFGKSFSLETHVLAKQANSAVFATLGGTQVLATAGINPQRSEKSFLPLSVDYVEKFYATGRIPGSYPRREGKPSDHEILVSRMIDRPIRPLFPKGFRNDVQLIAIVMSMDLENPSDVLSMNAVFAALYLTELKLPAALAAVRVARKDDKFIINPTYAEMEVSSLDLLVAGTTNAVTMIEGSAAELSEELMLEAVAAAHVAIKEIVAVIEEFAAKVATPKRDFELSSYDADYAALLRERHFEEQRALLEIKVKKEREHAFVEFVQKVKLANTDVAEASLAQTADILMDFQSEILRKLILDEDKRADGRAMNELRPIECSCGVLRKVHGSALFTRGETQALAVTALGGPKDKQRVDLTTGHSFKRFMLHYNFPPFSVGEVGRMGFTGRREIGHGMLAERSLAAVFPDEETFDYTTRLVSEILESNGSSSMATVCAGSLALMHAGVPLKRHVAGISMGLVLAKTNQDYKILSDIQGLEDHLGDMDFKVAGTNNGITGFQLDIKVDGITIEIMREALAAAKDARLEILEKMNAVLAKPAPFSENAPRRELVTIKPDKIKLLVGAGGKTIRRIIEQTKSDIDIDDEGKVTIFAISDASLELTKKLIEASVGMPKIGTVYAGKIKRITVFGAFVEIIPGVDGLCHISNLAKERIPNIFKAFSEGESLVVKVENIDESGRISLSAKNVKSSEKVESLVLS